MHRRPVRLGAGSVEAPAKDVAEFHVAGVPGPGAGGHRVRAVTGVFLDHGSLKGCRLRGLEEVVPGLHMDLPGIRKPAGCGCRLGPHRPDLQTLPGLPSVPPGHRTLSCRRDGDNQGQPTVSIPYLLYTAYPPLQAKGSPIAPRGVLLYRSDRRPWQVLRRQRSLT